MGLERCVLRVEYYNLYYLTNKKRNYNMTMITYKKLIKICDLVMAFDLDFTSDIFYLRKQEFCKKDLLF